MEAVSIVGDAGDADRILPVSLRSQPDRTHNLKCPTCGEPWIDCPHNLSDTEPCAPLDPDRIETAARAGTVISLLERCSEELARLELVPSSDADDVNALSAARGFVARARNLLCGRFQ
jgi:hypothetical protein